MPVLEGKWHSILLGRSISARTDALILLHITQFAGICKKEEFLHYGNPHTLVGARLSAASSYESIDGGPQHPGSRPLAPPRTVQAAIQHRKNASVPSPRHVRFKRHRINFTPFTAQNVKAQWRRQSNNFGKHFVRDNSVYFSPCAK
jgi:hypothetical protein